MRLRGDPLKLSDPAARRPLPGEPPGVTPSFASKPSTLYAPASTPSVTFGREKHEKTPMASDTMIQVSICSVQQEYQ